MKNVYRVHLNYYSRPEHEPRPTETTELVHTDLNLDINITASSISEAVAGAMAEAVKIAPTTNWVITCAEQVNYGESRYSPRY